MTRFALISIAALSLAAAGCGEQRGSATTGSGTTGTTAKPREGAVITIDGQKANDHGTRDVSGAEKVEMELDDFYFEPTVLTGAPGQRITVDMHNEGKALHNIAARQQGLDKDVKAGQRATAALRFPRSGQLVFVCKYHTAQNMRGGLEAGKAKRSSSSGDDRGRGSDDPRGDDRGRGSDDSSSAY